MILTLDPNLDGALHERIASSVRRAVASGELTAGARLPAARELAGRFGVNTNTVLRAYRQLSAEKLIELHRGRGAVISGHSDLAQLYQLADELLAEAARLGVTRGELFALLARRS